MNTVWCSRGEGTIVLVFSAELARFNTSPLTPLNLRTSDVCGALIGHESSEELSDNLCELNSRPIHYLCLIASAETMFVCNRAEQIPEFRVSLARVEHNYQSQVHAPAHNSCMFKPNTHSYLLLTTCQHTNIH